MPKKNDYNHIKDLFIIHKEKYGATDKILLNRLFELIRSKQPEIVLDLGCGSGKIAKELTEYIPTIKKIIAADISDVMIEEAKNNPKEKIEHVHISLGIIPSDKIQNNIADIVYSIYVLMEPAKEEEVEHILQNAFDKLKPGGIYYALNSNIGEFAGHECYGYKIDDISNDIQENTRTTTYLRIGKNNSSEDRLEIHDYYRSIDKYTELFKKIGFHDIKIERILVPSGSYIGLKDEDKIAPAYIISGKKPQ